MEYKLALALKKAGFLLREVREGDLVVRNIEEGRITSGFVIDKITYFEPTLSELIDACGEYTKHYPWGEDTGKFEFCLQLSGEKWLAGYKDPGYHEEWDIFEEGKTLIIAVANLWLALNKKTHE